MWYCFITCCMSNLNMNFVAKSAIHIIFSSQQHIAWNLLLITPSVTCMLPSGKASITICQIYESMVLIAKSVNDLIVAGKNIFVLSSFLASILLLAWLWPFVSRAEMWATFLLCSMDIVISSNPIIDLDLPWLLPFFLGHQVILLGSVMQ